MSGQAVDDPDHEAEAGQHRDCDPQIAQGMLDRILEEQAEDDDRDGADDHQPAHPGVKIAARHPPRQGQEPGLDDPADVPGEVDDDRDLGTDLDDRGEGRPRVAVAEELADDRDVRAGGDRQKLGQTLYEPEHQCLEPTHPRSSP
ncbi:hypothetical protein GCM10027613_36890 [Microlunatus endophyticus]